MILSGYQLMVKIFAAQRPSLTNVWSDVFPLNEPVPKSLIEISGAPGTGKSILLYELMGRSLILDISANKNSQVIFVNLSHKFDSNAFVELIQNLIQNNSIINSEQSLESIYTKCCESLMYLPCYSVDQFEFAFEEIENLLWDHKKISLLVIDGLDMFYWDDCNNQLQRMATHYKKSIQRLNAICQEHNICCAYTVDCSYLAAKFKPSTFFPYSQIDYKLKLTAKDGVNYLNDLPIKLNYDGIQFLKTK